MKAAGSLFVFDWVLGKGQMVHVATLPSGVSFKHEGTWLMELVSSAGLMPGPLVPSLSLPQSLWASTTVIVFPAKQLAALKIYLVML